MRSIGRGDDRRIRAAVGRAMTGPEACRTAVTMAGASALERLAAAPPAAQAGDAPGELRLAPGAGGAE